MSQVARLYGNSPALVYVGLRLLDQGFEVQLSRFAARPGGESLRPVRLRASVVSLLKEAFRRQSRPYFFLEAAPHLGTWGEAGKEVLSGFFDRSSLSDRWVSESELVRELLELFRLRGGRIETSGLAALPGGRGPALEIMDLDPAEISPEAVADYFPHLGRRPSSRGSELWLPHVRGAGEGPDFEFTRFEATLALSEHHPEQGKVFTLFSSSEYSLQRAIRALKDPRGGAPTAWKAQVLSESGPVARNFAAKWGYAGFYRPGVWCLGASIGKLNPVLNLDATDGFMQSERFLKVLQSLPRGESLILAADDWRRDEKAAFEGAYRRARFIERFFFSQGAMVDLFQKTSSFLPPRVRQLLKAPI